MASIHTIEILRDALSSTPIDIGQVIYCTDTIELFYDDSNNTRIQLSVQILQTESDRLALGSPEEKIYFVLETHKLWAYNNTEWGDLTDSFQLEIVIGEIDELTIGTALIGGKMIAPRTFTTAIYNEYGTRLDKILDRKLETKEGAGVTKGYFVTIDTDGQLISTGLKPDDFVTTESSEVSSGPDIPAGRMSLGAAGVAYSTLVFGGSTDIGTDIGSSYEYNGSSWEAKANMTTPISSMGSCGVANDAMSIAGNTAGIGVVTHNDSVSKFDGLAWNSLQSYPIKAAKLAAAGSTSAAIATGGIDYTSGESITNYAYTFDGSAWSAIEPMLVARSGHGLSGDTSLALAISGNKLSSVELYDGTTWSTAMDVLIPRDNLAATGSGETVTIFGGIDSDSSTVGTIEYYNGSIWISNSILSVPRHSLGATGTADNAASFCGNSGSSTTSTTEHYTRRSLHEGLKIVDDLETDKSEAALSARQGKLLKEMISTAAPSISDVPAGSIAIVGKDGKLTSSGITIDDVATTTEENWGVGTNLLTARTNSGAAGNNSLGLIFDGASSTTPGAVQLNSTERFDNCVCVSDAETLEARIDVTGIGSYNSTLLAGGAAYVGPSGSYTLTPKASTEKFDGSAWSESGNMTVARYGLSSSGDNCSALIAGGVDNSGSLSTVVNMYDGLTWSTGPDLLAARAHHGACGVQGDTLLIGGQIESGITSSTERYNNLTWSTSSDMLMPRSNLTAYGLSIKSTVAGGALEDSSATDATEKYNGITWKSFQPLAVSREGLSSGNDIVAGGNNGSTVYSNIEAISVDTDALNAGKLGGIPADDYLTKAEAEEKYGHSGDASTLGGLPADAYLTKDQASADYLNKIDASGTYLSKTDASAAYLTKESASTDYLSKTDAGSTYLTKDQASTDYLNKTDASATYLTKESASSDYLTKEEAQNTYIDKNDEIDADKLGGSPASNYLTKLNAEATFLSKEQAVADYLNKTDASSTYLSKDNANTTYLTKDQASVDYLNKADASDTYLSKTDAGTTYLSKEQASTDYLTKEDAQNTYINKSDEIDADKLGGLPSNSYLTKDQASVDYLNKADASDTYLSKTDAGTTYLTKESASTDYLNKTDASNTYLSKTDAGTTYLTKESASTDYLNKTDASNTYLTKDQATDSYLNKSDASNTYLSKSDAESTYLTKEQAEEKFGSGVGGNVSSAGDLPGATADANSSSGKSLTVSAGASTSSTLATLDLGKISLLGRYSVSIRIKSNYKSTATTNLLQVDVVRTRSGADTIFKTAYIRECDIYTTDDYCTFAASADFTGGIQDGDVYSVRLSSVGNANAVTWQIDYAFATLAGVTIFSI